MILKKLREICVFTVCFIFVFLSDAGFCKVQKTCYVSSTNGKDDNDGTIKYPFKSIQRATSSGVDTILIKAGDIFYESIDINGKVVDKYGDGPKPVLIGVKIPKSRIWENGIMMNGEWTKAPSSIWRINLSLGDEYYNGFKTNGSSFFNNAGAIINLTSEDLNNCRKVPNYNDMSENYDFWQPCPVEDTKTATKKDFDYLYLFLDDDPNDYHLGISMGTQAVSLKNGEVHNLNIKYWGFGILFQDNVIISNCDIDGIGGYIQRGKKPWVLLGNGIESWITPPGRHDCIIENCNISRTFDCGATIQGGNKEKNLRAENIVFRNNTFRNCCQSFEEFLRGPGDEDIYYNCVFENNVSIDAGIDTGFRYWDNRYKRCHFLSNSSLRHTKMIIRNNIAINGNYYCAGSLDGYYRQSIWEGNTCHINRGQDLLGSYNGTKNVLKVPTDKGHFSCIEEATDSIISKYRFFTGDQTTKFIIIEQ